MKIHVTLQFSDPMNGLFLVTATTETGRRFVYGYPDGKPRDGQYVRYLTDTECERLSNGWVASHGMINPDAPHWYETDPVYGSTEYQIQGCEAAACQREYEDDRIFG